MAADILDWPKSRTKVALFRVAGVEYQLLDLMTQMDVFQLDR